MAEKPSWDLANRRQKLGLVWRNRKKISQFYLLFFHLIILCSYVKGTYPTVAVTVESCRGRDRVSHQTAAHREEPSLIQVWLGSNQRVLNDLERARLSCGRMVHLLPPFLPPPPPSVSKLSLFLAGWAYRREEGGYVVGEERKSYDRGKAWPSVIHSILSGGSKHRMVWFAEPVVEQNFSIY